VYARVDKGITKTVI